MAPDYGDAYLATGLSKYLIGSSPAPVRWLLSLGGFSADKRQGIRELEWTAETGRYLAPFARLLLAVAYLRENDGPRARSMLEQLRDAFPENPLYSREIARIDAGRNSRMAEPVIAATATAVPDFVVTREVVKTYFGQVFPLEGSRLDAMMGVVDNSGIRQRFCVLPVDELIRPRSLERISQQYQEHAIRLGRAVATECLERAQLRPEEIDLIITVSCTGVMIPSLDAHLVNAMGFRSNVRRLPITELGCAAGASAIARGRDFLLAFPRGQGPDRRRRACKPDVSARQPLSSQPDILEHPLRRRRRCGRHEGARGARAAGPRRRELPIPRLDRRDGL